jgi:hypothetical protein
MKGTGADTSAMATSEVVALLKELKPGLFEGLLLSSSLQLLRPRAGVDSRRIPSCRMKDLLLSGHLLPLSRRALTATILNLPLPLAA